MAPPVRSIRPCTPRGPGPSRWDWQRGGWACVREESGGGWAQGQGRDARVRDTERTGCCIFVSRQDRPHAFLSPPHTSGVHTPALASKRRGRARQGQVGRAVCVCSNVLRGVPDEGPTAEISCAAPKSRRRGEILIVFKQQVHTSVRTSFVVQSPQAQVIRSETSRARAL